MRIGPLTLRNAILCDDVRIEKNNKHILIGVYSGDIVVKELPAKLRLSFYLEFGASEIGDIPLEIRITGPGKRMGVMKAQFQSMEVGGPAILVSPQMEIPITEEGTIRVSAAIDKKKWRTILEKKITLNPDFPAAS